MADKPARSSKKPFNPLLNVSVTGATLEEFTQNAILCPAAEPVVAPVLQTVPLNNHPEPDLPTELHNSYAQKFTNQSLQDHQEAYQLDSYNQTYNPPANQYSEQSYTPSYTQTSSAPSESTASSLLSSFSNILNFGGQSRNQPKKETLIDDPPAPNPNSIEHLLSATGSEQSVSSIPLYSASAHNVALSGPPLPSSSVAGPKLTASLTGPPLHGPPKSALSGHSVYSGPPPPLPVASGNIPTYLSGPPPPTQTQTSPIQISSGPVSQPPVPLYRTSPGLSGPIVQPRPPSPGLTKFSPQPYKQISSQSPVPLLRTSGLSGPEAQPQRPSSSGNSSLSQRPVPLSRTSPGLSGPPKTSSPGLTNLAPQVSTQTSFSEVSLPPTGLLETSFSSSADFFGSSGQSVSQPPVPLSRTSPGLSGHSSPGLTKVPQPSKQTSFSEVNLPQTGLLETSFPSSADFFAPSGNSSVSQPPVPLSRTSPGLTKVPTPSKQTSFSEVNLPQTGLLETSFPSSADFFGHSGHSLFQPPVPLYRSSPDLSKSPVGLTGTTGLSLPPVEYSRTGFPQSVPFFSTTGTSADLSGPVGSSSLFGPSVPPVASTASSFIPTLHTAPSAAGLSGPALPSGPGLPPGSSASSGPGLPFGPSTATPPSSKGAGNTFRRQNQKRPVYAPIPGFSSTPVSVQGAEPKPYYSLPAHEHQPVATANTNPTPPSLFTPVPAQIPEFQPPNLLVPSEISEVQPLDGTSPSLLATVMSDVSSTNNANPATLDSSATLHTLSSVPSMEADMGQSKQNPPVNAPPYRPVYHHWFHQRELEGRTMWVPFSMLDSLALEAAFFSTDISLDNKVATDGGRYDVNILRRQRKSVYWDSSPTEVRRCSWFFKSNTDGKFTPYEENIAGMLEEEYKAAYETNQWHRKIDLRNGETIVLHSPDTLVHFPQPSVIETLNQISNTSAVRPRVVKRGMDEFDIAEGEPSKVDHLLFLVHGIGAACDLKFRSVEEVVDDFRSISLQLVKSHYQSSCKNGIANRIEVLPVSWHNQLHSEETGIDKKLKSITLESIPRLRDFTNDTLLDILFYTSPIYSQKIISTVGDELNRIYTLFTKRNPGFKGSVSLGGHSLGSLILFDILCHQRNVKEEETVGEDGDCSIQQKPTLPHRSLSRRISYMMGAVGTGQPQIDYPHLNFQPIAFFALGSPIGMFVTVRGLESLGENFSLPTCPGFFNIFHPYDPVAYRVESLINPQLSQYRPVLIPHHKGRKRMHLELKETVGRIGADLKQRIIDSMKNTWNSVYQVAMFQRSDRTIEAEVEKVLREQQRASEENDRFQSPAVEDVAPSDVKFGTLNRGRRIDYVLQEAPLEYFNEYLFALTSHVCYWESEDTMLLIIREIYDSMGIDPDSQVPQQTMTLERSSPSPPAEAGTSNMQRGAELLRPLLGPGSPPSAGLFRRT